MNKIFCIYLFLLVNISQAALVGEFRNSNISAGYISFDKSNTYYKGFSSTDFNGDGIERRSPSEIIESFFNSANQLDGEKIEVLIIETKYYLKTLKTQYCIYKFRKKIESYFDCSHFSMKDRKFQKKWKKNRFNLALELAISYLENIQGQSRKITKTNINSKINFSYVSGFMTALEIIYAIRSENEQRGKHAPFMNAVLKIKTLTEKNIISENDRHASNLLTTEKHENRYYSFEELQELKQGGMDLSLLDPADSGLWRKPVKSISRMDTSIYDKKGLAQLNRILPTKKANDLLDKTKIISLTYEGDNLSGGASPKFDAYIGGQKFKVKFITDKHNAKEQLDINYIAGKAFWGSEVNVEPVVNNLASALGFTVDPNYFKESIRLYFDEEKLNGTFEEEKEKLIKKLTEKYTLTKNPRSAFQNIKVDGSGRKYVLMKSVSLEQKSHYKTDMNIGYFRRKGLGKSLKREHRALYLFYAFIGDMDTKDDNSKVKIVPVFQDGKTSYKVALSSSDMGSALGTGHPNFYNYKLIKKSYIKNGQLNLQLTHPRLHSYDLKTQVNLDDARWFVRRLSQISLAQMEKAFLFGGFPRVVSKYYAKIMSKKRNELVKALGMEGETFLDDGGSQFRIKLLEEFNGSVEGHEQFFKNGMLTDPKGEIFESRYEPFKRFWGASFRRGNGDPIDDFVPEMLSLLKTEGMNYLNNRFLSDFSIGNTGVGYNDRGVYSKNFFSFCEGSCFAQGVNFGIQGIIPLRYILPNPDESSTKPFIILDVFRSGFFIGKDTRNFVKEVGLNLSNYIDGKAGGKVYYMKEYIRVREAQSFNDYNRSIKPIKIGEDYFKKGFEKQLDLKNENYQLLVSQYIGLKGKLKLRIPDTPMSVKVGLQSKLIKRTLLSRKEGQYFLRYDSGNEFGFHSSLNIFDFLLRIPLVEYNLVKTKMSSRVVKFESKSLDDIVKNCMKLSVDCSEGYDVSRRQTYKTYSHLNFNFFDLFGTNRSSEKVFREFFNVKLNEVKKEKYYVQRQGNYRYSSLFGENDDYMSTAYMSDEGELNIAIDVKYEMPQAKSYHFKNFIKVYEKILPKDLVPYNLDHIKYYLGHLRGDINIVFDYKAMEKFFHQKFIKNNFCQKYGNYLRISNIERVCSGEIKDRRFSKNLKLFKSKYSKAITAYNRLRLNEIEYMKYSDLKILSTFFLDKKFRLNVVGFLISITEKKQFKRDVLLKSELAGFPGNKNTIKESHHLQGGREQFKILEMEMMGDSIISTLSPLFYSSFRGMDRIEL